MNVSSVIALSAFFLFAAFFIQRMAAAVLTPGWGDAAALTFLCVCLGGLIVMLKMKTRGR